MNTLRIAGGLLGALILVASASAADPQQACMDCHGKDGASTESDVPTIAGQSAAYIKDQMGEYAAGERPCPESKYRAGDKSRAATDMCKVAKALGDADAQKVSAYFAAKPFVRAKQKFDAAKAAAGKKVHAQVCEKCHSEGGSVADDDAGILAGQWMPYTKQTLADMMGGKRHNPEKMKVKTAPLKPDDVEALLQYYASEQ